MGHEGTREVVSVKEQQEGNKMVFFSMQMPAVLVPVLPPSSHPEVSLLSPVLSLSHAVGAEKGVAGSMRKEVLSQTYRHRRIMRRHRGDTACLVKTKAFYGAAKEGMCTASKGKLQK